MANEEIARFYTRSRRFPKLIGRMTDGSRIPGGPYTMTQVLSGGFVFLGAMVTRNLWTTDAALLDLAITAGVTYAAIYVVGFLPLTRRNLIAAFIGAVSAIFQPVEGKYQGKVQRLRRPHHVSGTALVLSLDPYAEALSNTTPVPTPTSLEMEGPVELTQLTPAVLVSAGTAAAARVPMSAVERLLQQAKSTTKENS